MMIYISGRRIIGIEYTYYVSAKNIWQLLGITEYRPITYGADRCRNLKVNLLKKFKILTVSFSNFAIFYFAHIYGEMTKKAKAE